MTKDVVVEPLDRSTATGPSLDPAPRLLRSGLTLLAVGAAVEAMARLLIVPWYDEPDRYVDAIIDQRGPHVVGAVLSFVAAAVIVTGLTRMWASSASQGRATRFGLTLALSFPLGIGAVAARAFTAGSFGEEGNRAAGITIWQDVRDSGAAGIGWYAEMLGAGALVVALIGLARRRAIPRVPTALLALGALTTAVTSSGPITGVLVTAALLLSAGATWSAAKVDPPG